MEYVHLRSGRKVAFRPIRADDIGRLEAAHGRLSPATRYQRFLAAKPRLTADELRYLTDVDQRHHVALIATPAEDHELIIAVGRFVRDQEDPAAAEFAIVVGDPYQGEAARGRRARAGRRSLHGHRAGRQRARASPPPQAGRAVRRAPA
jgi:hypothetical protein